VVQAPTLSRTDVHAAIDRFQLQRGTATGSGIVLALATLFPDAGIDLSQITGQRTTGPDPLDAARMAADRGVKVYTVGIGTKAGEIIGFDGWSMRVRLDEETLKTIAAMTRADYFYAGTADDLKTVYQSLSTRLIEEKKETEIGALFAALGALLVVLAAGLSVWWFGRVA
jgi:Ca-activated chloride channel family protein